MNTNNILMRNGVALWLIIHTRLSYAQIADFCSLHPLEVEELGNDHKNIQECNPISALLLSQEEIDRCEKDHSLSLKELAGSEYSKKRKGRDIALYNAVYWFVLNTELEARQISRFLKCTTSLVESVQSKTCKEYEDLVAIHPVTLGFCTSEEFDLFINK